MLPHKILEFLSFLGRFCGYFRPYRRLELEHFDHAFATNLHAHRKVTVVLTATLRSIRGIAMSKSPEVCQFSSTEAISQHCYNVSASNCVQRFVKGLGTFAFTTAVFSSVRTSACSEMRTAALVL